MRLIIFTLLLTGLSGSLMSQEKPRPVITVLSPVLYESDSADYNTYPVFTNTLVFEKYMMQNLRYPMICVEMGVEGSVFAQFVVNADTSIRDLKILRGLEFNMDTEVLRVLKKMPVWLPATDKNNQPTVTKMLVAIRFVLR